MTPAPSIKEALEFYADPFAWKKRHDPDNDVQVPDFYSELSFGDRAQETLASLTKSEGHGQDASVKCAATGVHPTDTSCTAEPEVAPGHSDALATFQPSGERLEAIARGLSISYGEDPDDFAFLTEICGPNNEPLQNWHKYTEQADYLLASGLVRDEAGVREKERLEAVAWAAQGLLNADTFVSDVPRAEAVSRATLKLQQALGTWQMHHCAVKPARDGGAET